jgi:DNA-directed RNA polymerase subunit M/transcription elongation factor TFIIS
MQKYSTRKLANQIQEHIKHIKPIIHHDQVGLKDEGMVQCMKIHQHNPLYKQTQRRKSHDHPLTKYNTTTF